MESLECVLEDEANDNWSLSHMTNVVDGQGGILYTLLFSKRRDVLRGRKDF